VVSEKEKAVEVLRNKLAAHDSPGGRSAREQQFEMRIAELRRSVEEGGEDARKLRREKLELEEKLKEREKAWKIEKERLSDGASSIQTHRDRQIEDLKARCFQLQTENTELRARCPIGMAASLRLAQERVRTLERQVGELETRVGGARTGPSVYDLLYDMAECISKMGKDMKEVRFVWLQWWWGAADSPLLCRRPLTANSGCR
jgi:chromosome segregation ATPase